MQLVFFVFSVYKSDTARHSSAYFLSVITNLPVCDKKSFFFFPKRWRRCLDSGTGACMLWFYAAICCLFAGTSAAAEETGATGE